MRLYLAQRGRAAPPGRGSDLLEQVAKFGCSTRDAAAERKSCLPARRSRARKSLSLEGRRTGQRRSLSSRSSKAPERAILLGSSPSWANPNPTVQGHGRKLAVSCPHSAYRIERILTPGPRSRNLPDLDWGAENQRFLRKRLRRAKARARISPALFVSPLA
jgi:hypothetical protein